MSERDPRPITTTTKSQVMVAIRSGPSRSLSIKLRDEPTATLMRSVLLTAVPRRNAAIEAEPRTWNRATSLSGATRNRLIWPRRRIVPGRWARFQAQERTMSAALSN